MSNCQHEGEPKEFFGPSAPSGSAGQEKIVDAAIKFVLNEWSEAAALKGTQSMSAWAEVYVATRGGM